VQGVSFCLCLFHVYLSLSILAVLVIRIWYLFKQSSVIRIVSVLSFLVGVVLSAFFVGQTFRLLHSIPLEIPGIQQVGCAIPPPNNFWKLFLPALVLHTLLFVLTALRAFRTPKIFRDAPLLRRLLREWVFCPRIPICRWLLTHKSHVQRWNHLSGRPR
jgi:hypothetical protein